jgi:hypothetical protein
VKLSNSQPRNFTVQSKVEKGIVYNEEMVCHFGPILP